MQSPDEKPPEKIFMKDFMQFAKKVSAEIYENDIKDAFYYLAKTSSVTSPRASNAPEDKWEEKLFLLSAELGRRYDEYVAEEENLKGVLNVHTLKTRNYEIHQKLTQWKNTLIQQREMDDYYQNKCEYILDKLKEFSESTMLEKDELDRRISSFYDFIEQKREFRWRFKTIMKFLDSSVGNNIISLKDLKRNLENMAIQKLAEFSLLKGFIEQIRQRCAVRGTFFSFFDVPDVILLLKYGKREYDLVIKFLKKAKEAFLQSKKAENPDAQITEDDVCPLELLDNTLSKMRYKQEKREMCINKLIFDCESEIDAKRQKLDVTKERVLQTIENNIFLGFLNVYLENVLSDYNLCIFVIKQLYKWISDKFFNFKPSEFLPKFKAIMNTPKTDPEFVKVNSAEIDKFSQRKKVLDTVSDVTGLSALAPKQSEKSKDNSFEAKPENVPSATVEDDLADAINVLNQPAAEKKEILIEKSVEKKPPQISVTETKPVVGLHPEEGLLSKRSQESKKEEPQSEFYKSKEGEMYDPKTKFGTLEKDYTEYDPHMTKYEAVLPSDYYMNTINKQSPIKKDQWFLRPHHIESLTRHPFSKHDDVLNTKYYSYYEAEKQKPATKEEEMKEITEDVIQSLEDQILKLRARTYLSDQLNKHKEELGMEGKSLSLKSAKDKSVLGKIEQCVDEVRKTMEDPNYKINKEECVMNAYEGILYNLRAREREILNVKRSEEYEKNRPPINKWYTLKTPQFSEELARNRKSAKVFLKLKIIEKVDGWRKEIFGTIGDKRHLLT